MIISNLRSGDKNVRVEQIGTVKFVPKHKNEALKESFLNVDVEFYTFRQFILLCTLLLLTKMSNSYAYAN